MKTHNLKIIENISRKHLSSFQIKNYSKNSRKLLQDTIKKLDKPNQVINILTERFKLNFKNKDLNKFKKFKTIVIIGMGGSSLGAEAIHQFFINKIKKKVHFLNDLDLGKLLNLKKNLRIKKTLFIVISKSGNTTETLSNLFYLNIIKKNSKNIVIITEKKNSILFNIYKKYNLFFIEHKNFIGGRYSVLSEVGLVPAYLMGLNIFKIRKNLKKNLNQIKLILEKTKKIANIMCGKKINNLVFLNYAPNLEKFLYWAQQLMAESLGKKGKGYFPVISSAPRDHHSLLQLYLDGPKDKLFYIFSGEEKLTKKLSLKKHLKRRFFLDNKNLNQIKFAQRKALINVFKKNRISFREFKLKNHNEETLGELFSYFILETIFVAELSNVNPFDQPAVEQVKKATKKILS